MKNDAVQNIVQVLNDLSNEQGVSKNVKEKIKNVIMHIEQDPALGKDKALSEFEELSDDDIEPYIRTQIWNVVSMLENL